jgi:predicted HTH transcriptional regulator
MTEQELLTIINGGETSKTQFKERLPHPDNLTHEMIAFSNSHGGKIIFGINDKTGELNGLSFSEIQQINRQAVNIASQMVFPPVYLETETVSVKGNQIVVVTIEEGISKPYKDSNGTIYVKNGSDKRKVTSNDEIARLLGSRYLLADETEIIDTSIKDIDIHLFYEYFKKEFGQSYEEKGLTLEEALRVKKVIRNNKLTLAGLLFFGNEVQNIRPQFTIKAVTFIGNDLGENNYKNKPEDLKGTIPELFRQGMMYIKSCINYLQNGQDFNSIGVPEISIIALEEVLQNALIHRDYYKNAPVRLLVFDNRIEIISPGRLPNSLTVDEIKYGNPVIRNNQLAMFASRIMPYSGLGSGVPRAYAEQPDMELVNDVDGDQFIVRFPRKVTGALEENKYKFSVYSKHGDRKVTFEKDNDVNEAFYTQLLILFSDVDYEKKEINVSCLHQMNDNIRKKIAGLTRNFEKINIQVRRIEKWFEEIQNGEYFYIFPETEFHPESILHIFGCIELLNNGVSLENLEKEMEKQYVQQEIIFSELFGKYEITAYGPKKKHTYGNLDKKSRVCKYCGKSMSNGATFHKEAHAIPESIGNKTIISADECDDCNDIFSKTIDKDIFEYLKLFRVLYGQKGKTGIPKLKFKNETTITHNGEMAIIVQKIHGNEDKINFSEDFFKIPLELADKINFMNIYRSLVKYVLAVIPNDEINNFTETVKWITDIKNNGDIMDLPSVAVKIDTMNYYDQPIMMIYKRKSNDISLPYMYAELRITNFIFVYIIPFSNKDTINFGEDNNFEYFWQFNKHYAHFKDWVFNKFNLDLAKETVINMQMTKKQAS